MIFVVHCFTEKETGRVVLPEVIDERLSKELGDQVAKEYAFPFVNPRRQFTGMNGSELFQALVETAKGNPNSVVVRCRASTDTDKNTNERPAFVIPPHVVQDYTRGTYLLNRMEVRT